jgi:hypothetical protein
VFLDLLLTSATYRDALTASKEEQPPQCCVTSAKSWRP